MKQTIIEQIISLYIPDLTIPSIIETEKISYKGKRKTYQVVKRYWIDTFADEDTWEIVSIKRSTIIMIYNDNKWVPVFNMSWTKNKYIDLESMSLEEIIEHTKSLI